MEVSNNEHLTFGMVVVLKWFEEFSWVASCWKATKWANDIRSSVSSCKQCTTQHESHDNILNFEDSSSLKYQV